MLAKTSLPMRRSPWIERMGLLGAGFYAWLISMASGAVLIDVSYTRLAPGAAAAFGEGADLLLMLIALAVLAALPAIGLAWKAPLARTLLIGSLLVLLLEFFIPAFFGGLLAGTALSAWIRIGSSLLASLLACASLAAFPLTGAIISREG